MNLGLEGRRALVCGASGGLGLAVAETLAAEGARVGLNSRAGPRLEEAAGRLSQVPVPADLSTPEGPGIAVQLAVNGLGGIDLLLVNAGGPPPGDFDTLSETDWTRAIDGTMLSSLRLVRAALDPLRSGLAPAIAIILSSSVRSPLPGLTTSNVLRPALAGLVKTLSVELAPEVRVNGLAPGRFDTERVATLDAKRAERARVSVEETRARAEAQIPLARYGDPRELAEVAAFLLSERASYVTGQVVVVDGGSTRSLP